jgi:hypothetical protein
MATRPACDVIWITPSGNRHVIPVTARSPDGARLPSPAPPQNGHTFLRMSMSRLFRKIPSGERRMGVFTQARALLAVPGPEIPLRMRELA